MRTPEAPGSGLSSEQPRRSPWQVPDDPALRYAYAYGGLSHVVRWAKDRLEQGDIESVRAALENGIALVVAMEGMDWRDGGTQHDPP
jgi:hypothetical protein